MNRLDSTFEELKKKKEKALIIYITAGDPDLDTTLDIMYALSDNGADILEIGFPFSEPMADGSVIQRAIHRSIESGTTLDKVLELISMFRQRNQKTPVVLMGYLNPVFCLGYQSFARKAAQAGVDGVLVVDCPVESIDELSGNLKNEGIESIFLVTPTTSMERVKMIATRAGGFLYYVSLKGVTGSDRLDMAEVEKKIRFIKTDTNIPIVVGFGIKDFESVQAVSQVADGAVVGSRIIEEIENNGTHSLQHITSLVKDLKRATKTI
ncbi:MAG: tryptophan synthase subunit alpha [Neisseriaceae bacterium]|nr:MAG: tryptophan synthase subunit alpha [Neisseriaceae bacterium]